MRVVRPDAVAVRSRGRVLLQRRAPRGDWRYHCRRATDLLFRLEDDLDQAARLLRQAARAWAEPDAPCWKVWEGAVSVPLDDPATVVAYNSEVQAGSEDPVAPEAPKPPAVAGAVAAREACPLALARVVHPKCLPFSPVESELE